MAKKDASGKKAKAGAPRRGDADLEALLNRIDSAALAGEGSQLQETMPKLIPYAKRLP